MTTLPRLFVYLVSRSTKPKHLSAAFLKPALIPILFCAQAGNGASCASSALATFPQASSMQQKQGEVCQWNPNPIWSSQARHNG